MMAILDVGVSVTFICCFFVFSVQGAKCNWNRQCLFSSVTGNTLHSKGSPWQLYFVANVRFGHLPARVSLKWFLQILLQRPKNLLFR